MSDSAQTSHQSRFKLWHYALALALMWTVLIVASLVWSVSEQRGDILGNARYEAQNNFEKELLFQFWKDGHGGSVSSTNNATTNPGLARVEEPSPVYPVSMLRQLLGPGPESAGPRSHLASLKPTWPANTADAWETGALKAFAKGETEVASITAMDGQDFLRVMRPLVTEASCLACHGGKDYKVGDIRGGLSVSVPLAALRANAQGELTALIIVDGVIWVLGLGVIGFGARRILAHNLERAHAEAVLRDSEERYRTVIENVGEGFCLVNPNEQFTFVNPAAEDIFGVPRGGLLGRNLREFTPPDQFDRIREQTTRRRAGERSTYELVISRPGGEQRILLMTTVPQVDRQGELVGAFGVLRDITERKQVEAERERVIGELRETLAETKTLSGLLPICAGCKKIRDEQNTWRSVEVYIHEHTGAKFTHGICPECIKKYYPDVDRP